jgi:hypothetical protein
VSEQAPVTVIVIPQPTVNGPLHIGHLSGPYLGADVAGDGVALVEELHPLQAGDVGSVAECHVAPSGEEGYSVEFFNMTGRTVAVVGAVRPQPRRLVDPGIAGQGSARGIGAPPPPVGGRFGRGGGFYFLPPGPFR